METVFWRDRWWNFPGRQLFFWGGDGERKTSTSTVCLAKGQKEDKIVANAKKRNKKNGHCRKTLLIDHRSDEVPQGGEHHGGIDYEQVHHVLRELHLVAGDDLL